MGSLAYLLGGVPIVSILTLRHRRPRAGAAKNHLIQNTIMKTFLTPARTLAKELVSAIITTRSPLARRAVIQGRVMRIALPHVETFLQKSPEAKGAVGSDCVSDGKEEHQGLSEQFYS